MSSRDVQPHDVADILSLYGSIESSLSSLATAAWQKSPLHLHHSQALGNAPQAPPSHRNFRHRPRYYSQCPGRQLGVDIMDPYRRPFTILVCLDEYNTCTLKYQQHRRCSACAYSLASKSAKPGTYPPIFRTGVDAAQTSVQHYSLTGFIRIDNAHTIAWLGDPEDW